MIHDARVEIIPAINAESWEKVREKIRQVEPYAEWVHLDIADGTFTKNTLWHDPADLVGFSTSLAIELHLMIARPEERIRSWLLPGVRRAIVHHETVRDADLIIAVCRNAAVEPGIAIATDTPWTVLKPYAGKVSFFQILAVHPGLAGQEFQEHNYDRIRHLREWCLSCTIEADGGVQVGVAQKCVSAGANVLAAASAIFGEENLERALRDLRQDALME